MRGQLITRYIATPVAILAAASSIGSQSVEVQGERAPSVLQAIAAKPTLAASLSDREWQVTTITALTKLDTRQLQLEDIANANVPGIPMRIGIDREIMLPICGKETHNWSQQSDGYWIWRKQFQDPGAQAIRVSFSGVNLETDDRLLVADAAEHVVETISNTSGSQLAWTGLLPGDTVAIELRSKKLPAAGTPVATIYNISHIYKSPISNVNQPLLVEPADTCNVTVACRNVNEFARDSVGQMVYSTDDKQFVCSGALLNDLNPSTFRLWFLTAHHCISTQPEVDSLTVYWLYQASACGGSPPVKEQRPKNSGGRLLVTLPSADMAFIELSGPEPGGVGFAGWTTAAPSGRQTGIHHPGGRPKEYSQGELQNDFTNSSLPASSYLYGIWDDGVTEGGSSGSPLFNPAGQVVGQLYGKVCPTEHGTNCIGSNCSNRSEWRFVYGRFDVAFDSLRPFIQGTWVDFQYNGTETGSQTQPYNTLAEGIAATPCGGQVLLVGNRTASQPGTYSRAPGCPVTIRSVGGSVTIQ